MGTFEYVMVLVSIVVGLAITHILATAGETVHRLRGHGARIRLDPVFLLRADWALRPAYIVQQSILVLACLTGPEPTASSS